MKGTPPLVLIVLDGWGIAPAGPGNAIALAKKPSYNRWLKQYPHTELQASGLAVGLPEGTTGNSEAGHMNIGAGRVVLQDASMINNAILDGSFAHNEVLLNTIAKAKKNGGRLHIISLIAETNCSPHSCIDHMFALMQLIKQQRVSQVYFHLITDGRDSQPHAAHRLIEQVQAQFPQHKDADYRVVSVLGRYYAMDRARNWDRTQRAYDCLVTGKGIREEHVDHVLEHAYDEGLTDEYVEPTMVGASMAEVKKTRIKDHDTIIFMGLRSDRARQLTKAIVQAKFTQANQGSFRRSKVLKDITFCALTDFGEDLNHSIVTAFPSQQISDTLPYVLRHFRQHYLAEAEKFAHVTYFMNGGFGHPVNGEVRIKIPSKKIKYFAQKPEMSAKAITDKAVSLLQKKQTDVLVLNFANADVVGHSGDMAATVKAVAFLDHCMARIVAAVKKQQGTCIITSDHGNAEAMLEGHHQIRTSHSPNPVPFILIDDRLKTKRLRKKGILADIAPTIYDILNVQAPPNVTGKTLLM